MTEAYLDAAPSGSALRALLGAAFEPQPDVAEAMQAPRGAALREDLRFFASAYLLGFVFFLLLLL